jgi:hypothetical protein
MNNGFEKHEEGRRLRIGDEVQFRQSAEVVSLAIGLARALNSQPQQQLEHAWKLIEAAREIVAPLMSEEEIAMRAVMQSGGSKEALAQWLEAREKAQQVPYESLISDAPAGQKPTEITNPFWTEDSGPNQPQTWIWRKLTPEGFREAVDRFVTYESAVTRGQIDSQLGDPELGHRKRLSDSKLGRRKRLTTWFQHGPPLLRLLDSMETVCGDIPYVIRYSKHARQGVHKAKEHSHLAHTAERIVFRIIQNADLYKSEDRRTRLLDEWEEIAATRWKEIIIYTLNEERGLPLSLVWRIDESRRRGASERSLRGAKTRQLQSSQEPTS